MNANRFCKKCNKLLSNGGRGRPNKSDYCSACSIRINTKKNKERKVGQKEVLI